MLMLPPNLDVEILPPNVLVFEDGALGRWLGHSVKPSGVGVVSL